MTLLDNISPLDQAEAQVLRPDWCSLKDACLPKHRDNDGVEGEERFDLCYGISRGKVLSGGDTDLLYARFCYIVGEGDEPHTLGLDLPSAARFIEGIAIAHRAQLDTIISDGEEEQEES